MNPLAPLALWHPTNLCHMVLWFLHLIWSHCLALLRQGSTTTCTCTSSGEKRAAGDGDGDGARVTAVVTGAASGIGYAMARQLAGHQCRYHVVLLARSEESAKETLRRLKEDVGASVSAEAFAVDLADPKGVAAFAEALAATRAARPPLRLLVNNAGIYAARLGFTADPFALEETFASNVFGHWLLTEELAPVLAGGGSGACVVGVSSFSHRAVSRSLFRSWLRLAQRPLEGEAGHPSGARALHPAHAYACSKLALVLLAHRCLRPRRGREGVRWERHICVDPGAVDTGITRRWPRLLSAVYRAVMAGTRLFNSADAIAFSVLRRVHEENEAEGDADEGGEGGGGLYLFGERGVPLDPSPLAKDEVLADHLVARLEQLRKKCGV